jgi:hypothetical protein
MFDFFRLNGFDKHFYWKKYYYIKKVEQEYFRIIGYNQQLFIVLIIPDYYLNFMFLNFKASLFSLIED